VRASKRYLGIANGNAKVLHRRFMADRERHQLVVSLGEGQDGQRAREVLDRAAAAAGKTVSTWARDALLSAAGEVAGDPIAEVLTNGNERTFVNLRLVVAMQTGWVNKVRAILLGGARGEWLDLGTRDPDGLFARWRSANRTGLP
jgi:hypothetical protein